MSLKPIAPKGRAPKRGVRSAGMPVVVVQKKQSGSGGLIMGLILIAALAGGGFIYYNQQQNEAALAAKQARLDANAAAEAENARLKAEYEQKKLEQKQKKEKTTAMGSVGAPEPAAASPAPAASSASLSAAEVDDSLEEEEEEEGAKSAMGSTSAPTKGDGVFNVDDTTPPPFDLKAEGKAAQKVIVALDKEVDKAGHGNTFHDLQADLKRSFDVAQPGLFADASTLPAFPDKNHKLLRMAQGIYVCLTLAAELDARNTIPSDQHAKFVNWLMKDKAKAARTFTFGLEHCGIHDVAKATDLLDEVRQAYLISPSSGMKKIPAILKAAKQ